MIVELYLNSMSTLFVYLSLRDIDERIVPHTVLVFMVIFIILCLMYQIGTGYISAEDALMRFFINGLAAIIFIVIACLLAIHAGHDAFGGGDIKLIGIMILGFGWLSALCILFFGCICCIAHYAIKNLTAILLSFHEKHGLNTKQKYGRLRQTKLRKQSLLTPVPFVPYICMGMYVYIFAL